MTLRTGSDRGLTLIEVLVAIVVLGVGLAGLLAALGHLLGGAGGVVAFAQGTWLAERILGELELQALAGGGVAPGEGQEGRFRWAVAVVAAESQPPLARWTVTVTWPSRLAPRRVQLTRAWSPP